MHASPTVLRPTTIAELERVLRAAAEGRLGGTLEGLPPPVLVLTPFLRHPGQAAQAVKVGGTRRGLTWRRQRRKRSTAAS